MRNVQSLVARAQSSKAESAPRTENSQTQRFPQTSYDSTVPSSIYRGQGPVELYRTTDLHVASVLACLGHRLEDVSRKGRGVGKSARAVFCFRDNERLHKDLLAYNNDEVKLSPRLLFARLRDLKSQACNLF